MSETKTAATVFPGTENMKKLYEDQAHRMGQAFEEMGKAHTRWIEYGNTQIDEMNELAKTQFNYFNELAANWRKMSVETIKKSIDSMQR